MKTLTIEEAKQLRGEDLLAMLADDEAVVLTQDGEGRYILGPVDDFEWEVFSLSHNAEFMAYLDKCGERAEREGCIPLEEARRRLGV